MHPMTPASSPPPHTKPVAGAHSPSVITRITFGVMDIERKAIPYLSYAYPIVRFQSNSNQVPMRFQWRQGADKGQVIGIYVLQRALCGGAACWCRVWSVKCKGTGLLSLRSKPFYVVARGRGYFIFLIDFGHMSPKCSIFELSI